MSAAGLPVLQTGRLSLHPWRRDDLDTVLDLHQSADVNRYLASAGRPWTREEADRALESWMDQHRRLGVGKLKLVDTKTGDVVGRAGFSPFGDDGTFELGFTLAPRCWGRGYATEIGSALANWFFDTGKADRFIAFAHPQNAASLRVLEKLGMRAAGTVTIGGIAFPNFEMSADSRHP